ncbi:MAG: cadmium resistance transporter [Streptococcus sp.]
MTLLTFLVMIYLLVFLPKICKSLLLENFGKYSRWFVAVVYLGLGMYILIENNILTCYGLC